jgi:hypothetical protein
MERREKRKALDVVPVIVGQQERDRTRLLIERLSQPDAARARVEDEDSREAVLAYFDAGGIAPVLDRIGRRPRGGASHTPEADLHAAHSSGAYRPDHDRLGTDRSGTAGESAVQVP